MAGSSQDHERNSPKGGRQVQSSRLAETHLEIALLRRTVQEAVEQDSILIARLSKLAF